MDLKGALYYMAVGNVPFDSVVIQELRRQVRTAWSPAHCGVLEELEDLFRLLMRMNPRYRLTGKDIMKHLWFKNDWKAFLYPCDEVIPLRPDPAILTAMAYIGFWIFINIGAPGTVEGLGQ